MRKIVFTNDKGGVGKTTTVANMAVGLANQGHKTLVVDMDPQGDATFTILGANPPLASKNQPLPPTIHTLLLEKYEFDEVVKEAPRYPNLFILASNKDLSEASGILANRPGAQTALFRILKSLPEDSYDFVLIDTGKGLDALLINSLAASDEVVVMVKPGQYELKALDRLTQHVEKVRTQIMFGTDYPRVTGILLALTDHYSITKDARSIVDKRYPGLLMSTEIPSNIELQKAASRAKSIFEFNPKSKGAKAYKALVKEVLSYDK